MKPLSTQQELVIEALTRPCPECKKPCFETLNRCRLEPLELPQEPKNFAAMSVILTRGAMIATSPLAGRPQYLLHEHQPEEGV